MCHLLIISIYIFLIFYSFTIYLFKISVCYYYSITLLSTDLAVSSLFYSFTVYHHFSLLQLCLIKMLCGLVKSTTPLSSLYPVSTTSSIKWIHCQDTCIMIWMLSPMTSLSYCSALVTSPSRCLSGSYRELSTLTVAATWHMWVSTPVRWNVFNCWTFG